MGYATDVADTLARGRALAAVNSYDAVFLDVMFPDGNGIDAIGEIRAGPGSPEVVIITGSGDPDGAALAISSGAWDYLEKGSSLHTVSLTLGRILQYQDAKRAARRPVVLKRDRIIGGSRAVAVCLEQVAQASRSDAAVLITGETGTGKELFALAIHDNSSRKGGSFVVVDCASLPETLIQSALFGHSKGAFTGADAAQAGLIRQANGGTLFLDEIGEMPLTLQRAFLRVLQERRYRPVGSDREEFSDFRLVAATHRDLDAMVTGGRFREDLLYRLRGVTIQLPALRDRREDISDLVHHHVSRLCERGGFPTKGVSPDTLAVLCACSWPGNVRELVNAIDGALAASVDEPVIFPKHLPMSVRIEAAQAALGGGRSEVEIADLVDLGASISPYAGFRDRETGRLEREYLLHLRQCCGGDVGRACLLSGLSRSRLYELLKKHGLSLAGGA